MDTYALLLIVLVLAMMTSFLFLYRELRRVRIAVSAASQMDPCKNGFELRMRCVDMRLQDLDKRL